MFTGDGSSGQVPVIFCVTLYVLLRSVPFCARNHLSWGGLVEGINYPDGEVGPEVRISHVYTKVGDDGSIFGWDLSSVCLYSSSRLVTSRLPSLVFFAEASGDSKRLDFFAGGFYNNSIRKLDDLIEDGEERANTGKSRVAKS